MAIVMTVVTVTRAGRNMVQKSYGSGKLLHVQQAVVLGAGRTSRGNIS